MGFVKPKTFLIGCTSVITEGFLSYLRYTGNEEFAVDYQKALMDGISPGEALCSFYAKLCYKSLTPGKNSNISRVRDIKANLENVVDTGHFSVLEHCTLNFITTDCTRVFTHELVRHRAGTAFSQTSGRYVRLDDIQMVLPPELEGCEDLLEKYLNSTQELVTALELRTGLRGDKELPFDVKKKLTSAIRRIAPNGQTNEIGWTVNLRSLRHIIEMRTSRHAEWEIRYIINEVADIVQAKWPHILYGAKVECVNGLNEYTNLRG